MVAPKRHEGNLEALTDDETSELMRMVVAATRALKAAYEPDGVNVGVNLGRAAGAGSRVTCMCTCCRAGTATPTS